MLLYVLEVSIRERRGPPFDPDRLTGFRFIR